MTSLNWTAVDAPEPFKQKHAFLSDGYSFQSGLLFSVIATILIALAGHCIAAMAAGMSYSENPPAPLRGSQSQQADLLYERCKAAEASLPHRRKSIVIIISALYSAVLLIPMLLDQGVIASEINEMGFGSFLIGVVLCVIIFALIYAIPYGIYQFLSSFLYHVRRQPDLGHALFKYAQLCQIQEAEQRRIEEEQKRIDRVEQDRQLGDTLYQQAFSDGAVDEKLVQQAAELGCYAACLYMGRQKMAAWATGLYTKNEKEKIAQEAKLYFSTASLGELSVTETTEARFGYLLFQSLTESGDANKWEQVLLELRDIEKSGNLPEQHRTTCSQLVRTVIDMIDSISPQSSNSSNQYGEPTVKRYYCKFFNAGVCGYYSTSSYLAKCNYVSAPGQCSAALQNHGLEVEFE